MLSINNSVENNSTQKQQSNTNIEFVKKDFLEKIKMGIDEKQAFEDAINSHLKRELKDDIFENSNSNVDNEKKYFMASKLCKGIKPGKILDYLNAIETVVSFTDMLINIFKKENKSA